MKIKLVSYFCISLFLFACSSSKNVEFGSLPAPDSYVVKKGDTLFSISWRYGLNQRQVEIDNNIADPSRILIGQKLKLKPNNSENEFSSYSKKSSGSASGKKSSTAKKTNSYGDKYYAGSASGWSWPLNGRIIRDFNSGSIGSTGIRIQGKKGQIVNASSSGVVVYQGAGLTGYGNVVIIKHNDGLLSAYGFLSSATVKEGQRINKKDKIGYVGYIDKNVLGLHFEVRKNGKPINPKIYIGSKYHF